MEKTEKMFLKEELNIDKLSPLQFSGIIRAMRKYAEYYNEHHTEKNDVFYKVYTKNNMADTSRDKDNYVRETLGNKLSLDNAIDLAKNHIKNNFFRTDTELKKGEGDIVFSAMDFCSYPEEIIIKKVKAK
jgi:translation initiation factor 2B subunit (eIF-2B alpha/beta/delta family)